MTVPEFEDPRVVLRRHRLAPKRAFSQNFLVDQAVVEAIADAATVTEHHAIVELGPGCGTLTAALLRRGRHVLAVERDRDMIALLQKEFAAIDTFEVIAGDASSIDLGALRDRLGVPITVAGNLPYSITGEIVRHLVDSAAHYESAVIMVQQEVRDRLVAQPATREYGALTVFVQARMRVESVLAVPSGAFHPAPRVDSAVARLVPMTPPRAEETPTFRRVVRASFQQRRKMLRNALRQLADAETLEHCARTAGFGLDVRGEVLSVEQFAALAQALDSCSV